MKILYIADLHLRAKQPKNRTDDIVVALKNKLIDIIKLTRQHKVDYVFCGGDIFDGPNPAVTTARLFTRFLDKLKIDFYAIAGNHDIHGHNIETLSNTLLGFIGQDAKIDNFILIEKEATHILTDNEVTVRLFGLSYDVNIDRLNKFVVKEDDGVDWDMLMIHSMLIPKKFFGDYVLTKDFKTNVDLVLCSHYHKSFDITHGKTRFINVGGMFRTRLTSYNVEKKPQIGLLTFSKESIEYKAIKLPSAGKFEDVFDLNVLEERAKVIDISALTQAMRQEQFVSEDIKAIVEQIAKDQDFNEDTSRSVLKRIQLKTETMET